LEFYERLIEVPDGLESLSDAIGEDPAAGEFPASE
jgi:hypothetical protein